MPVINNNVVFSIRKEKLNWGFGDFKLKESEKLTY